MSPFLLYISVLFQYVFGSNHVFNTPYFNAGLGNPVFDVNCQQGADCFVTCNGINSCIDTYHSSGSQIISINGPNGKALTININSNTNTNWAPTFNAKINCSICSSLTINVPGAGGGEFSSKPIIGSTAGNNKLDCRGPAHNNIPSTCNALYFIVANGFGTGAGQAHIVDTSNTAGRNDLSQHSVYCVDPWYEKCRGSNPSEGLTWNIVAGYAECDNKVLSCQITTTTSTTTIPVTTSDGGCIYELEEYLSNCYCGGETSTTTTATATMHTINTVATAATIRGIRVDRGGVSGYVSVSMFDYYFMRLCSIVVLIGFCIVLIKLFMGVISDCNRNHTAYSNVKYDIDSTDFEH